LRPFLEEIVYSIDVVPIALCTINCSSSSTTDRRKLRIGVASEVQKVIEPYRDIKRILVDMGLNPSRSL
jgi:hypothetical protein